MTCNTVFGGCSASPWSRRSSCRKRAPTRKAGDPPNPYRTVENWAKLPDGRKWGQTISVDIDRDGKSIWVFERCGGTSCDGSDVAPILKIDPSGNVTKSFGAGMFVFPHGLHVDRDGNVWATDGRGKGAKGQQVYKFSPDGKVLMTLGKAGVTGDGPDTFNSPSDVLVAPNGDIFVADGHGGDTNARIVKFSKDGTFIKAWGKKGSGAGRVQRAAPACHGFERPAVRRRPLQQSHPDLRPGWEIPRRMEAVRPAERRLHRPNDIIYVADSESNTTQNPGFKRGLRIGSAKDGKVSALIPDPVPAKEGTGPGTGSAAEGVAADADGNVYGAEVDARKLMRYVKK